VTEIASNISSLRAELPLSVKLIAVSKTKPVNDILEAWKAGQRFFGENRVQELLDKKDHVPGDVEWHLIGHLQTNKVKFIVPFISMIQSVDSLKLLNAINTEASKINKVVNCLLQIHIAEEETKYGFSMDEIQSAIDSKGFEGLKFLRICGVMGMATFTDDFSQVRKEFLCLREDFKILKAGYFGSETHFKEISMGMSGDYKIAIEEGSTMVRIGSLLFGERQKQQLSL
jgi:pyridoxal phosphate enzyme (YggS family)